MTERADEAAGVQRRLKEEAAQRRAEAASKGPQSSGRGGGLSAHGRRRTP